VTTEPPPDHQTVLIRVTGPDHAGVTAGLMGVLADAGAQVQDIEQIVIRGQLTLGVAVAVPEGRDLLRDVLLFGWDQGMATSTGSSASRATRSCPTSCS